MLAILWIGDPASPRGPENSVSPSIDISGSNLEAPIVALVEIDAVQEDDDFWRGGEWTLKVDTHGGGSSGIKPEVAGVFAGEKFQMVGCEDENVIDAAVDGGVAPGCDVAVSPMFGEGLDL